ncbi:MAG TPA: GspH/FimT family pseudopilin [Gemmatimonadaceae bacterium]|nr:GspH/FimT family pseudopilin [Gemmatimonadaceae bacterium]
MRSRFGFTAIEMVMVTALIGITSMIALPKLAAVREQSEIHGAKRQILTQLAGARGSAIQRGRTVQLRTVGNQVWLTSDVGGSQTSISPVVYTASSFGVTVTASHDPITFDARGFATSLPATGAMFVLESAARRDSICVTRLGLPLPECGL